MNGQEATLVIVLSTFCSLITVVVLLAVCVCCYGRRNNGDYYDEEDTQSQQLKTHDSLRVGVGGWR